MAKPPEHTTPLEQAKFYDIPNMKRHLLLCAGPECCDPARGEIAWNYLKKRFTELKLQGDPTHVFRTRCACLRICTQGPILAVQPDNAWYHSADPEILERIIQEHLLKNEVVQEFAFTNHPLCTTDPPPPISHNPLSTNILHSYSRLQNRSRLPIPDLTVLPFLGIKTRLGVSHGQNPFTCGIRPSCLKSLQLLWLGYHGQAKNFLRQIQKAHPRQKDRPRCEKSSQT